MAETKLLGLRSVIYAAPDLNRAKSWYAQALGIEPYFDQPFYVGFNVGGYELGLDPNLPLAEGSTITYWGIEDIEVSVQHFLDLGASIHAQIQHVGDDIHIAALKDPFGNVVGLIENPHFSL
ncbi:VOC family protein [Spirosoma pollinicola]|uniref:Glyoxalase/bleomycin resistance/extradiol dioxygenase family protein n=1 Tax=Spirosoma pollinicola TaxID=2057025 RepID=A0A2K8Z929_9BACT|nr:VOC family protein [Spirosoma pollinicola]AUD06377.1 glyoxalase/bleomycin resistance/extradiol dioxygenase family protein [Spirosoma pollinicola]